MVNLSKEQLFLSRATARVVLDCRLAYDLGYENPPTFWSFVSWLLIKEVLI